jgi:hypothetical protein
MAKKPLSRGRGPRLRDEELEKMVALYLEGKSFKAIAKEVGRHWQTVRKYTIKALQEREGRELRREALKEALADHFRDLVHALGSVRELLGLPTVAKWESYHEWQPASPDRRNHLLLQALRESHAKESPLWDWWDSWNQTRKAYEQTLSVLWQRTATKITGLDKSNPKVFLADNRDFLLQVLFQRAVSIAHQNPLYNPSMLRVLPTAGQKSERNEQELWFGQSTKLAIGQDMGKVRQKLSKLMKNIRGWKEVKELEQNYLRMAETRDRIDEEIEVLSLRRAFPGHCRLCPI